MSDDPGTQQLLGGLKADVEILKDRIEHLDARQADHARRFAQLWGVIIALGAVLSVLAWFVDLAVTLSDQAAFDAGGWLAELPPAAAAEKGGTP